MELLEGIETRRSCRAFKPTPVPRKTLEKIIETAARSPSYSNSQPWEVAVVCGDKKNELATRCDKLIECANEAGGHDNIAVVLAELLPDSAA